MIIKMAFTKLCVYKKTMIIFRVVLLSLNLFMNVVLLLTNQRGVHTPFDDISLPPPFIDYKS